MATVTFDTYKYVKQLESAGIAQTQAEALVATQRDILSDVLDTHFACKADIFRLESKIDLFAAHVDNRFEKIEARFTSLDARFENLELRMTIKLGTIVVIAIGAMAAIVKFL